MKWLGFHVRSLLSVNLYDYPPRLVMDSFGHTDCIVEKVLRVKGNTFFEWMFLVKLDRMDAVQCEDIDLRNAVGRFFGYQKPSVAILFQQVWIYHQGFSLPGFERLIFDNDCLLFAHGIIYRADKLRSATCSMSIA